MRDSRLMMRVRPATRPKLEHIAKAKRWTLTEAIDASADAFLAAEGMTVSGDSKSTKPARKTGRPRRKSAA